MTISQNKITVFSTLFNLLNMKYFVIKLIYSNFQKRSWIISCVSEYFASGCYELDDMIHPLTSPFKTLLRLTWNPSKYTLQQASQRLQTTTVKILYFMDPVCCQDLEANPLKFTR